MEETFKRHMAEGERFDNFDWILDCLGVPVFEL